MGGGINEELMGQIWRQSSHLKNIISLINMYIALLGPVSFVISNMYNIKFPIIFWGNVSFSFSQLFFHCLLTLLLSYCKGRRTGV